MVGAIVAIVEQGKLLAISAAMQEPAAEVRASVKAA
jgi:hypothetical protein